MSSAGEILLAEPIAIATESEDELGAAVAYGGGAFVVTWGKVDSYTGREDVYAARVTSSGEVLDPAGVPIAVAPWTKSSIDIASDGASFLIVWSDLRSGEPDVFGTRVGPDLTVLDPDNLVISMGADRQSSPNVAFTGSQYLVVWGDRRESAAGDIYGTRVSVTGEVLDPLGLKISDAPNAVQYLGLAGAGGIGLVVWQDARSASADEIYATRVAEDGSVLDPAGFVVSTAPADQGDPAVTVEGDLFLTTWRDCRGDPCQILAARVGADGSVLDPVPERITADGEGTDLHTRAAVTDSSVLIAYSRFGRPQHPGACSWRSTSIAREPVRRHR